MLSRWVVSSEEERFLDTEEVTGSIPVPPTNDHPSRFPTPSVVAAAFRLSRNSLLYIKGGERSARQGNRSRSL